MNKVILLGNLGSDPEVRRTQSGNAWATFRIATTESWRDKQTGERRENTQWHTIVVWNEGLAKVVEQYVRKGDQVLVVGQLETRKWQDQQGQDRYSTEVVLKAFRGELTIVKCKAWTSGAAGNTGRDDFGSPPPSASPGAGRRDDMDDEIPF
jgi:single-strand DNA-binding protein